jgi:hypothetical protein
LKQLVLAVPGKLAVEHIQLFPIYPLLRAQRFTLKLAQALLILLVQILG